MKRIILHFGADGSFHDLVHTRGFYRRNSNILRALAQSPLVDFTINVQFIPREIWKAKNDLKRIDSEGFCGYDLAITSRLPLIFPGANVLNKLIMQRHIQREIHRLTHGTETDIVSWCYLPKGYEIWKAYWNKGISIFDADHNIIDDPHRPKKMWEHWVGEIDVKVGHFISSSRCMNAWVQSRYEHPHVHLLLNGVDKSRFSSQGIPHIRERKTTVVGYVGQLSRWMDVEALKLLIQSHPSCTFRFAGENHQTTITESLQKFQNVEFVGRMDYSQVPDFLNSIDIGLSVYKTSEKMDVNSMKIYEYLAAHLPVLALRTHSRMEQDFKGLLNIADNAEELCEQLSLMLKSDKPQHWHQSVEAFIDSVSWNMRVNQFLSEVLLLRTDPET